MNKKWVFIALVIVILFALVFIISPGKIEESNQDQTQQTSQTTGTIETKDTCKRSSECFLASCKSKPTIIDCVNSTTQELYYRNCINYVDVKVTQDITTCACIEGICEKL
jgi:hypothetical protein